MDKTEPGKKGHFPTKPAVTDIAPEQAIDFEQWKHRPPYQIQSPDEFGEAKWSGSCQCGQVTYKIRQEKPLIAKYCHCHGCQVMHGGFLIYQSAKGADIDACRCAVSMVCGLLQARHMFCQGC